MHCRSLVALKAPHAPAVTTFQPFPVPPTTPSPGTNLSHIGLRKETGSHTPRPQDLWDRLTKSFLDKEAESDSSWTGQLSSGRALAAVWGRLGLGPSFTLWASIPLPVQEFCPECQGAY